ncbi:MAG: aminotransferase class I/II-fold pyridoxal phosphate-dependent enzyme [Pseudomonadales bacterium]|nr:aminotransferase class I/II-fold pyridoxal phosphate-dependent enzyme [Pseudomonadales bacterium]
MNQQNKRVSDSAWAETWIDASTGINPFPYPVNKLPDSCAQRLPESHQQLTTAAHAYYQPQEKSFGLLPIAGSQWFIQRFPEIIGRWTDKKTKLNVQLPALGYREHEFWWRHYQHTVCHFQELNLDQYFACDVVVIINPNNPTTITMKNSDIQNAAHRNPDTLFIVDEAFMDSCPNNSCLRLQLPNNIIILRSLGKFFGLAGLRIGFVCAPQQMIAALKIEQGPWAISGPSEWLARQALEDNKWQQLALNNLKGNSAAQRELLAQLPLKGIEKITHCDYFSSIFFHQQGHAYQFHQQLLANNVLSRYFEETPLVRIGTLNQADLQHFRDRCLDILERQQNSNSTLIAQNRF